MQGGFLSKELANPCLKHKSTSGPVPKIKHRALADVSEELLKAKISELEQSLALMKTLDNSPREFRDLWTRSLNNLKKGSGLNSQ